MTLFTTTIRDIGGSPLPLARVGAHLLPLLRERPVHASRLPVLLGAVGPGAPVRDAGLHDHVAPPPHGLGGVAEHDDGGTPHRCARSSP